MGTTWCLSCMCSWRYQGARTDNCRYVWPQYLCGTCHRIPHPRCILFILWVCVFIFHIFNVFFSSLILYIYFNDDKMFCSIVWILNLMIQQYDVFFFFFWRVNCRCFCDLWMIGFSLQWLILMRPIFNYLSLHDWWLFSVLFKFVQHNSHLSQ